MPLRLSFRMKAGQHFVGWLTIYSMISARNWLASLNRVVYSWIIKYVLMKRGIWLNVSKKNSVLAMNCVNSSWTRS